MAEDEEGEESEGRHPALLYIAARSPGLNNAFRRHVSSAAKFHPDTMPIMKFDFATSPTT